MRWLTGLLGMLGCVGMVSAGAPAGEGRAWTPADSVALRYFLYDLSRPEPLSGDSRSDDLSPAALSPDGQHFFFVAFSGDLERDESIGQIHVFSVQAVLSALKAGAERAQPLRVIELRSRRGGDWQAPVLQPRWADDSTVEFVGTQGDQPMQLYHADINTGELLQLSQVSNVGEDVAQHMPGGPSYEVVKGPGERPSVVYTTGGHVLKDGPLDMPLNQYPSAAVRPERVRDEPLYSVFHPWKSVLPTGRVYARYQDQAPQLVAEGYVLGPWLSPDGRHAVLGLSVPDVPASWQGYQWREYERVISSRSSHPTYQFHLLDLRSGEMRAMLDAPLGPPDSRFAAFAGGAFWSQDSSRVLLVNTRLPLSEAHPERARQSYLIDYRVADGQWTEVMPIQGEAGAWLSNAQWDRPHDRVLLRWAISDGHDHRRAAEYTLLTQRGGRWRIGSVPSSHVPAVSTPRWPQGLKVSVREDMNTPQAMVAERSGRSVALSPPDPALAGVHRQPWTQVDLADGEQGLRGHLLRPVASDGPLPLVILMMNSKFYEDQFLPDGARYGGFAGQSLAAQGFAVLALDAVGRTRSNVTPHEGPASVRAVDAAIDHLGRDGMVDPKRVGLVGFSQSGYNVNYVITHPGAHRIGAAVIFDSITHGYGNYVNAMAIGIDKTATPGRYAEVGAQGNAPTFWENREAWLDAPAFNLHRVRTPALFTVTSLRGTWGMLETVGGWRHMQLPFEYRIYPEGSHVLTPPRQQEDALRGTVEWMGFWLQGRAPQDEARAAAWRGIQERWQARLKQIDAQQ